MSTVPVLILGLTWESLAIARLASHRWLTSESCSPARANSGLMLFLETLLSCAGVSAGTDDIRVHPEVAPASWGSLPESLLSASSPTLGV